MNTRSCLILTISASIAMIVNKFIPVMIDRIDYVLLNILSKLTKKTKSAKFFGTYSHMIKWRIFPIENWSDDFRYLYCNMLIWMIMRHIIVVCSELFSCLMNLLINASLWAFEAKNPLCVRMDISVFLASWHLDFMGFGFCMIWYVDLVLVIKIYVCVKCF